MTLPVPRSTSHGSLDKWVAGGQAAAVVSGAFCLSSNNWQPAAAEAEASPLVGPNLGGRAWIIDPDGEVVATTSEQHPFATASIDLAAAAGGKQTYPRYISD